MKNEKQILNELMLKASQLGNRLWRNNVGIAYQGIPTWKGRHVILKNARCIKFGLCKGSSDLIGYKKITIKPEHVGKTMAVFHAVEVKTEKIPVTKEQDNFIRRVNYDGGEAEVYRE